MPNHEDYLTLLPEAEAVNTTTIKTSYLPIDTYLAEAHLIYQWSLDDLKELTQAGLPESKILLLPQKINALSEAQSLWKRAQLLIKEEVKEYKALKEEIRTLFQDLIVTYKYLFAHDSHVSDVVKRLQNNKTLPAITQNILSLALIGTNNKEFLAQRNVPFEKITRAYEVSKLFSKKRAQVNCHRQEGSPEKKTRDAMYHLLKCDIDDIKACAKYVFRNNKERLKGYQSQAIKKRNTNYRTSPSDN